MLPSDCSPGLAFNSTDTSTAMCTVCPSGQYCVGGDKNNPSNAATNCTTGLTTKFAGAKSEAQVCMLAGSLSSRLCLHSSSSTSASTTARMPALTTPARAAPPPSQCFTLPGYGRRSVRGANGKISYTAALCPLGSYNVGGNTRDCEKCPPDTTTLSIGSSSPTACCEKSRCGRRPNVL